MKKVRLIKSSDIPHTSDYEISKSINGLKSSLSRLNPNWRLSSDRNLARQCLEIETELCYLQREIMWRKKREVMHKEYIKNFRKRA